MTTSRKPWLIPWLEKVRAGLGAAGMAAVGTESMVLHFSGGGSGGLLAHILPVAAALVSAAAAVYFTEVSPKEAALKSEAAREGTMVDAATQ